MDPTDGVWIYRMDGVGIVMINMSFLLAVLDDLHLLLVTLVKLSSLGVDLQIQIQIQIPLKYASSSPVSELTFFFSRVRDSSLILLMKLIRSSLMK